MKDIFIILQTGDRYDSKSIRETNREYKRNNSLPK